MLSPIRESRQDFDNIDYLNLTETHPKKKPRDRHKMETGLSCVGILWAILSFISLGLSLVAFFMPYWIEGTIETSSATLHNNSTATYFGLWRRCNYHILTSDDTLGIEVACGRYNSFLDIPSVWWQIATVVTGVGCVISMFISFLGILTCCVSHVMSNDLAKTVGVLQFIAGLCITVGCVLYPFGWEKNLELQQACGDNISVYHLGECSICWAYWVAVAGGASALVSSILGCYSAKQKTRIRYDRVGL